MTIAINRSARAAQILALPEAAAQPTIAGMLAKAAGSVEEARGVLRAAQTHAADVAARTVALRGARAAEAKASANLWGRMTGRARPVVEDKRPPVSGPVAAARAYGDSMRRARGLPPRTGI